MKNYLYSTIVLFIALLGFCKDSTDHSNSVPVQSGEGSSLKKIIFFGDSLTAGMGLSSVEESFPMVIQKKLTEKNSGYSVINAGVSGDTTSGGLSRLNWALGNKPEIFILELGANDAMRGIPAEVIKSNLKKIISNVRKKYPDVKIVVLGMKTFPNMGVHYTKRFEIIYPQIRDEENIILIPFFLDHVAGVRKLNQSDGIHPTAEGHRILAENVYKILKNLL